MSKKLPESPFKEIDKLTEKLLLDIADKTDKALVESLNDLIKAGILEIRYLVPHSEFHENYLTVKSGVQVVPKFDEYTKKLEFENSELKKQLIHLSEQQTERIQRTVNDKQYIMKLEAEVESLKERLESENSELKKDIDALVRENNRILEELTSYRKASECFRNFLKL